MRIGHGYDLHRFGAVGTAVSIRLAGVEMPHNQQIIAHSDGDVLIHALCDALLGAMCQGDIGQHFSDQAEHWRDTVSREFLCLIAELMGHQNYELENADLTLICEAPRIGLYRNRMCERIAEDLGVTVDRINVKATTAEGVGAVGRGEAIAAHAVVLLRRKTDAEV
ncbi:MAG: 2-C-methyl-D-erythritol 2,4-cyclodiphosphate synthase [Proteobacteria bacterium]|nr:2-C-methyl-D-erythritol 2,4-cyclodiphosphate synthase [Pseudomonadota bacterium]